MKPRGELEPLNDVRSDVIRVNYSGLPTYINPTSIGIRTGRIERLMGIGGISNLTVNLKAGERSEIIPQIVGVTSEGGALAGKSKLVRVEPHSSKSENNGHAVLSLFRWVNGGIDINTSEIAQRILESKNKERELKNSGLWARHVNNALKDGLATIGTRNLVWDVGKPSWLFSTFQWSIIARDILSYGPVSALESYFFMIVSPVFATLIFNLTLPNPRESHFSLNGVGPQFDRAIALNLLARRNLAKKL